MNDNKPPPVYTPANDKRDELNVKGAGLPPRTSEEEVKYRAHVDAGKQSLSDPH